MPKKKIGKYIVDLNDQLGQGSCAKVYRGKNAQSQQQVAVKIIDKQQIQTDQYMKNAFYQEVRIMMKLKSTNIIGFLDVNQTKSNFYVILQIANQGTLRDILKQRKKNVLTLTENQTIKYLIQLLNGFGQMFKYGVIHRDIKPDNIFVKDGKLKIGDFGFAKNNQKLDSMMSTIVGSPAYMAPQILNKQKYTYKCDVWSLGIMTYQMLVGQLPFTYKKAAFCEDFDKDRKTIYKTVIESQIQFPEYLKISDHMQNFIRGCLEIQEQKRFDWARLFLHPIFRGIFKQNFQSMKKGEQMLAYIMGSFRMIFNQYNVDIKTQLGKLQKSSLTVSQFSHFLEYLNCQITQQQANILCQILRKKDIIILKDFQNLLDLHQCMPTSKPLSNESILVAEKKKLSLVKNLIRKKSTEKDINFKKLIPQQALKNDALSIQEFQKLIKSIAPQVPNYVLPEFRKQMFDSSKADSVPIKKFIQSMQTILKQDNQQKNE